jgi:hypothetical protein
VSRVGKPAGPARELEPPENPAAMEKRVALSPGVPGNEGEPVGDGEGGEI